MAKKLLPPKHKHGVTATEFGWACNKTGKILKRAKGLLEQQPAKEVKKEEPKAEVPCEDCTEECETECAKEAE